MVPKSARIAVVGAGISGLVLALQLHAAGYINVKIYESSKELKELGVGINLLPSAVLVLRNLGLLPELEELAISCRELLFFDQYGNKIIGEARGVAAGYAVPQLSIHRGQLQGLLLRTVKKRLGEHNLLLGHTLESFRQSESSVSTTFKVGGDEKRIAEANVLLGADGINSAVRATLYPNEGPPKFSGRMLWRGCCEGVPYLSGARYVAVRKLASGS